MKQQSLLKQIQYETKLCTSCGNKFTFKRFYRDRCDECMKSLEVVLKNHYGTIKQPEIYK